MRAEVGVGALKHCSCFSRRELSIETGFRHIHSGPVPQTQTTVRRGARDRRSTMKTRFGHMTLYEQFGPIMELLR